MPAPAIANQARANDEKDEKKKNEPLPPVTVKAPTAPLAYRVSLDFAQIPAGRAASLDAAEGTAVQATLRWTDIAGGFTGTLTAVSQTKKKVPWQAREQLVDDAALSLLSDGKNDNMEGTVEAAAVRRIARAFSEMLLAGGPVDHSVPVTLKLSEGSVRPGDYVAGVRNNRLVGEVAVDQVNKKNVTGTVLWGTHLWKKGDKFIPMAT